MRCTLAGYLIFWQQSIKILKLFDCVPSAKVSKQLALVLKIRDQLMVDHEGVVKEIHFDGIQPSLHVFTPENAPEDLLPHPQAAIDCIASSCLPQLIPAALLTAALVIMTVLLFSQYYYQKPKPKTSSAPVSPSSRIVIVDFHPFSLPTAPAASPSSSVSQVEAMLRFADVRYTKRLGLAGPDIAPMSNRAGYFQHGENLILSDSYLIIRHLIDSEVISSEFGYPKDPVQRATALAIQRMCETDLQAALAYFRYFVDENWQTTKEVLGASEFNFPIIIKHLMLRQLRVSMLKRIIEQRMGRRTIADVLALVRVELQALDSLLEHAGGPYLFGATPCAADAAVFGVLDQFVNAAPLAPQLAVAVWEFPRLEKYVFGIRNEFFGEDYAVEVVWEGRNVLRMSKNTKKSD
jgi:glutathione S-transferase